MGSDPVDTEAMDLAEKRIIVTGCASGMGAATVRAYVKAGAQVVGMDISETAGSEVCANAEGSGTVAFLPVDVADTDRVQETFAAAVDLMGGLDALAHPAAIHAANSASEVSATDWDHLFAVNVRGTMLTNQTAHKYLKDAGVPQDENLPKASKRARRKDLTSIQMAIASARQRAADAFAKADEETVVEETVVG